MRKQVFEDCYDQVRLAYARTPRRHYMYRADSRVAAMQGNSRSTDQVLFACARNHHTVAQMSNGHGDSPYAVDRSCSGHRALTLTLCCGLDRLVPRVCVLSAELLTPRSSPTLPQDAVELQERLALVLRGGDDDIPYWAVRPSAHAEPVLQI